MNTKKEPKISKITKKEVIPMNIKKDLQEIAEMKKHYIKNENPKKNERPYPGRERGGYPQRVFKDLANAPVGDAGEICYKMGNHTVFKSDLEEIYILHNTVIIYVDKVSKTITLNNYNDSENEYYNSLSTERAINNYHNELKSIHGDYKVIENMVGYALINDKIVDTIRLQAKIEKEEQNRKLKAEAKAQREQARAKAKAEKESKKNTKK